MLRDQKAETEPAEAKGRALAASMRAVRTAMISQMAARTSIMSRQPRVSPRRAAAGTPTKVEAAQPVLTRPRILARAASELRSETVA
jgi:hypothetical protein